MTHRFDPADRALADFCIQATHAWKNRQYEVTKNGEAALLQRLRPFAPKLLLDVGANIGEWTIAACESLPEARVHAFEIAPSTATTLIRDTASLADRIVINPIGLGDAECSMTLYVAPQESTIASVVRDAVAYSATGHGLQQIEEVVVQVIPGDLYLRQQGIDHVDVLKIDVEGAEFLVLHGFTDAFARGAIDLVQFEYGSLNLTTRKFLGDFYAFFDEHGYVVGKLFPEGVAFKPYELDDEDFVGPNYIACHNSRPDLIAALRCQPLTLEGG